MAWVTLAEGTPDEFEQSVPPIDELPPGTKLKLYIDTTVPIAPILDLWGAEWVVQHMAGEGVIVTDVHSTGWNQAVVEGRVAGHPAVIIILAILAVLAIGGIAYVVHQMKLIADIAGPVGTNLLIIGGVVVAGLLGYAAYRLRK
jgi:hypothetical protein